MCMYAQNNGDFFSYIFRFMLFSLFVIYCFVLMICIYNSLCTTAEKHSRRRVKEIQIHLFSDSMWLSLGFMPVSNFSLVSSCGFLHVIFWQTSVIAGPSFALWSGCARFFSSSLAFVSIIALLIHRILFVQFLV